MGFIERRNGRYRARYRDPLGRQLSETFSRKLDAERFLREVQVDIERGRWLDSSRASSCASKQAWCGSGAWPSTGASEGRTPHGERP